MLAFVHGLLYVFIVPPWQHYDEPAHFEYAALIAGHGRLPQTNELDVDLRREIAQSMERTGFYQKPGKSPDLVTASGEHIPLIGYSQLSDPPLYYAVAAVPIYLLRNAAIETQLRAARIISVLLLLVTVASAWGIAREVAPEGHALRWALPVAMALLPTLAELLAALNNDAIAIAAVSVCLWGAVRFVARGGWRNAVWVMLAGASLLATKNTAWLALPALFVALVFGCVRGRWRVFAWAGLGFILIAGIVVAVNWGDPSQWYRNAVQSDVKRCASAAQCNGQPPNGAHAFRMTTMPDGEQPALVQLLSADAVAAIRGKPIVVGAYIWTDATGDKTQVALPSTIFYAWNVFVPSRAGAVVTATRQPTWHTFTTVVPADASFGSVELAPVMPGGSAGTTLYVDAVSLTVENADDANRSPGNATQNWIRNGSAEEGWPWLRVPIQRLVSRVFPDMPRYNFLMVPFDPPTSSTYFGFAAPFTFETFWGRFSWGQIAMPKPVFVACLLIAIASLLVTLVTWPRWRTWLSSGQVAVLAMVFVPAWAFTLLRGTPYVQVTPFLTTARYGFTAIVPTLLILLLGWTEVTGRRTQAQHVISGIVVGMGGVYAVACLVRVSAYFWGSGA